MSFPDGPMQDDALVTEILGPKCSVCGWRRGLHRLGDTIPGIQCPPAEG